MSKFSFVLIVEDLLNETIFSFSIWIADWAISLKGNVAD